MEGLKEAWGPGKESPLRVEDPLVAAANMVGRMPAAAEDMAVGVAAQGTAPEEAEGVAPVAAEGMVQPEADIALEVEAVDTARVGADIPEAEAVATMAVEVGTLEAVAEAVREGVLEEAEAGGAPDVSP
jgi:hypothetical protein